MPSLDGRDVHKTYVGKMKATQDETDHALYVWWFEGRAVLRTELSTPYTDLGKGLVAQIARQQLQLPGGANDLAKLVNCTMSAEEWQEHLKTVAGRDTRHRM